MFPIRIKKSIVKKALMLMAIGLGGCVVGLPINLMRVSDNVAQKRLLQIRNYETSDEGLVLSASAGVLQDLGFTIDETETKLGFIVGSKERNAKEAGQLFWATVFTALSANQYGGYTNYYDWIDAIQKIQACVVTNHRSGEGKTTVRVTFQRIVWNQRGEINRIEALKEATLYQGFFEKLSKAVFLEKQSI